MGQKRRKSGFNDPEVQGALARRISIHWVLYTCLATVLVVGLKWMADPFTPLTEHLAEAWFTYGPILLVLVCLAPVFVYDAIKLSNRFTGPMMRLRSAARSLAAGHHPGRINVRQGDFWKELATDFNAMVDRLDETEDLSPDTDHKEA